MDFSIKGVMIFVSGFIDANWAGDTKRSSLEFRLLFLALIHQQ